MALSWVFSYFALFVADGELGVYFFPGLPCAPSLGWLLL